VLLGGQLPFWPLVGAPSGCNPSEDSPSNALFFSECRPGGTRVGYFVKNSVFIGNKGVDRGRRHGVGGGDLHF